MRACDTHLVSSGHAASGRLSSGVSRSYADRGEGSLNAISTNSLAECKGLSRIRTLHTIWTDELIDEINLQVWHVDARRVIPLVTTV